LGVRTLHPGTGGGMWVGSMQGASFFDGESWTTFSTADGLAGNTVQAIAADSTGRTWFGTDRGLSVWNGEVFFNIARDRGLPSDDISALAADGDAMWIGTSGGGLYRFENSQLQILNRENVGLPSDVITALAREGDGSLWIGTDQGLARLEDGALALAAPVGAAAITSLTVTPTAVWAGTAGDGAWYFDGSNWSRLTGADGLPAEYVTSLLAAGDGVWIGGQDGGLVRFQP
jgi:ligand-binding sensor domain-containing protein